MDKSTRKKLIGSMLKIGCFGFGGGTALIPVLEKELVDKKKLITKEDYEADVIAASITPGALPVEIASGIGKRLCGKKGMIPAAACMALPGALGMVLLLSVLSQAAHAVMKGFHILSMMVCIVICWMLISYIVRVVDDAGKRGKAERYQTICIIAGVFLLTGEKNIYRIAMLERTPLFGISTIHLLMLAFFLILYDNGERTWKKWKKWKKWIVAGGMSLLFLACVIENPLFSQNLIRWSVEAGMVVLAGKSVKNSLSQSSAKVTFSVKKLLLDHVVWLGWILVLSFPAVWIAREQIGFCLYGMVSTMMSFGGGDAYLTVADALFVDTGFVSKSYFYEHIVTIANVLPGSILCKMLPGMGYYIGYQIKHSIFDGCLTALAGFGISVGISGMVFSIASAIYRSFENTTVFSKLQLFMKPIIAGLLVNVIFSMLMETELLFWIA